jgi:alpha-D-ribose 1-methylphosphonate 5-triphosphate diphosphatase PhnM
MDRAFRNIVTMFDMSITQAAMMCSTTPARAMGLTRFGVIAEGNIADACRPRSRFSRHTDAYRRRDSVRKSVVGAAIGSAAPHTGSGRRFRLR